MAADWRDLAGAVEARIDALREGAAEPADDGLAERLWAAARDSDGTVPLDAAAAVARLYWARHQALAPRASADDDDLGAAVAIFVMIDAVEPDAVPDELRLLVDDAKQAAGSAPFDNEAGQVVDLLTRLQSGLEADRLDEVIERLRGLLAALLAHEAETSDDRSTATTRSALLSDLSLALHLRVERTGDGADVAEMVRLARAAITTLDAIATPDDSATLDELETLDGSDNDQAGVLGNGAMVLGTSFEYSGDLAELDEAIDLGTRALERLAASSPQWKRWASNLSGLHRIRFDRTDAVADLDRAVELATEAAELTPPEAADSGLRWSNLSNSLDARYGWTGERADLDAAIETGRRALDLTPMSNPDRAPIMANVANLCLTRFEQWGGLADVDEAIALGQEALRAGPLSPPKRAAQLSNLSNAHRFRYEHLRRTPDLDRALECTRAAVDLTTDDDPWRASRLTNHAMALLSAFERSPRPELISEALAAARAAVDIADTRPSLRSKLLSNLAVSLAASAAAADDPAERAAALDDAVHCGQLAVVALPAGHPDRATRLNNLAGMLLDRSSTIGADVDADTQAAIDHYRLASEVVTAPTGVRMNAARSQGATAARRTDWPGALDGYRCAVGLLGALVTRAIPRTSREVLLNQFAPLASEAAACAIAAIRRESAVELLEQSRAVLWSQALDTGAARALRTADTPLARRLATLAAQLE